MTDLRDKFLQIVTSSSNSNIVIIDSDGLLEYPELREVLFKQGFRIFEETDGLNARIRFELDIRGAPSAAALVVSKAWRPLPDIKQNAHCVEVGLTDLLPRLSSHIIRGLRFGALELLAKEKQYAKLDDAETLSFAFEVLFSKELNALVASPIKEYVLSELIDIIFESRETNSAIQSQINLIFQRHFPGAVSDLNQVTFLRFVQDEWERFLGDSSDVNFDNPQLRKRIAEMFLTGRLTPVKISQQKYDSLSKPLSLGCYYDLSEYQDEKFAALLDRLEGTFDHGSTFDDWRQVAGIIAELALCSFESENAELQTRYTAASKSLNDRFQAFIETEYDRLFSLSGVKRPATVTRVLEHIKFDKAHRKVLLVLDGVNLWQWRMISERLTSNGLECRTDISTAFIPSITAWSRQAVFKGSMPDLKANNSKEEEFFRSYWAANGFSDHMIGFGKVNFGQNNELPGISDHIKILGLVSNDLDDLMHAVSNGNRQLQNATCYWLDHSSFVCNVKRLKEMGFAVFITTDHGSVEATGRRNLKLLDKLGSISRSKRHNHFSNSAMLESFVEANRGLDIGIRGLSAFMKNDEAFTSEGDLVVTHGGSHFWEVLIPFVKVL